MHLRRADGAVPMKAGATYPRSRRARRQGRGGGPGDRSRERFMSGIWERIAGVVHGEIETGRADLVIPRHGGSRGRFVSPIYRDSGFDRRVPQKLNDETPLTLDFARDCRAATRVRRQNFDDLSLTSGHA